MWLRRLQFACMPVRWRSSPGRRRTGALPASRAAGPALPDCRRSGPHGGHPSIPQDERKEVTRSDRPWGLFQQAGAVGPALPDCRRSGPLGGHPSIPQDERKEVTRSERPWGLLKQAGAAGPALPDCRRSGPLGGQGATRSARPWGPHAWRYNQWLSKSQLRPSAHKAIPLSKAACNRSF